MKNLTVLLVIFSTFFGQNLAGFDRSCARGFAGDDSESFGSGANDIVVVKQEDGTLKSTAVNVQVRYSKRMRSTSYFVF